MMNNIKNTMCRLSTLTQEQIDSLVIAMPKSPYFLFKGDRNAIGFYRGDAGTWYTQGNFEIVTYTEMMQLLGKDMNKQTAQEQIAVMQIEMDKLKAIIDKPEAKTGRVMRASDLQLNTYFWSAWDMLKCVTFNGDSTDRSLIEAGLSFHDEETAKKYLEYLKLEQELRRAQLADGGGWGRYVLVMDGRDSICSIGSLYYEKISFSTQEARDKFRHTHTDEQLTLLIRGV